jgi:hypothetical protein
MPFPTQNYNLHSFRNTIRDLGRSYLYLIKIPQVAGATGEALTCFAKSTSLPAYTINTTPVNFQGMEYKLATAPTFDAWTVNFLCDENHTLRHRFLGWQSQIFDAQRQVAGSPINYKADNIEVSQLGRAGNIITTYKFIGAFPSTVAQIALDHSTQEPESFEVTFTYDYYVIGAGNGVSANDNPANAFIKLDSAGASFGAALSVGGASLGLGVSTDGNVNLSLGANFSF